MYKINKSIVLNEVNVLPSQANKSAPVNLQFTKKVQEKALSTVGMPQQSVYDLAKVVSSQSKYQVTLWDNLSTGSAPTSLFTAIRSAWSERKGHIP